MKVAERKCTHFSVRTLCLAVFAAGAATMLGTAFFLFLLFDDRKILAAGAVLTAGAFVWQVLLMLVFRNRLALFVTDLCGVLDRMIHGEPPGSCEDSETQFARIFSRLARFYQISQKKSRKIDEERNELQMLISDISHQVKTPVSNLKMVTDTLLSKQVGDKERTEFLKGIRSQADKLDFLFEALVKTSRLETGAIRLEKKTALLFDTLARAVSDIVYRAEKKQLTVTVDCPQELSFPHDSKWTAEALFNLLDNAVKYTPPGGSISVSVEQWEMYVRLDVSDTGRGISESSQAAVFRRFYREEAVHDEPGVGIGLYLAREIVTRQGGYVKVVSQEDRGSTFSVFLPVR